MSDHTTSGPTMSDLTNMWSLGAFFGLAAGSLAAGHALAQLLLVAAVLTVMVWGATR